MTDNSTDEQALQKKSTKWYWLIPIVLVVLVIGSYFYISSPDTDVDNIDSNTSVLDPKAESTHLSKIADTDNVYFQRGFDVIWNTIEPEKGEFDWTFNDQMFGNMQKDFGNAYPLSIIWPYANWDQQACHEGDKYLATGHLKQPDTDLYMGAPCDLEAYGEFVEKVVERYDGDGIDDMPNLETPIKYWEILNEPSMQGGTTGGAGEDLKFYVGSSMEYFEILKTSYESIKKADSDAKVLHAGMAGMQESFQDFWKPVFEAGAGDYFDIANIHSISTTERTEDLFVTSFKEFLSGYGIEDKPIWVTEAQYGDLQEKPSNTTEFEQLMAKSVVFSLAKGADKIFLIENWIFWETGMGTPQDDLKDMDKEGDLSNSKDMKEKKEIPSEVYLTSTHKVYLNLVDKVNHFDSVEVLNEKFIVNSSQHEGTTSEVGHYKFINGDSIVYVLWGKDSAVAPEISGTLKITDIYGESTTIQDSELVLTDVPIFVEIQ